MEIRHLRYFLAVAEELHFGRAATRLHIAQPSLTQQIQNLEAELGVPLLVRTKRRVELTEAGRLFQTEARLVMEHWTRAIQVVQQAGHGELGQLSLAYAGATMYRVLPRILQKFYAQYPRVNLTVNETSTEQQLALFDQNLIQVGLLHPPIRREDIVYQTFFREPMILALSESHPLATEEKIDLKQLADESFILFQRSQGPWLHDQITSLCQQAGFTPRVVQETCPPNAVLGLVAAKIGVAFVAESLQLAARSGIVFRPIAAPPILLETAVAWSKTTDSPVLHRFVEVVRDVAHQQGWDHQ
ncbi:MAG: LysR family transcriptional regulator [Oculatellaceae cyanobacterium Prado106]|jgi:DNA-binding transcriptional LysR family regulator|nr:LysR family transcriptional regulator [Oculatellaceae cyanobacterium Prado106]